MSRNKPPQKSSQKRPPTGGAPRGGEFLIEGRAQLEEMEKLPADVKLKAYAFDPLGQLLGEGDVDAKGGFRLAANLAQPADVELFISPDGDAQQVRKSSAFSRKFSAKEWVGKERVFRLNPEIFLPHDIWYPWLPVRVCVSGHVRKIHTVNGQTEVCPVPYVKVEIFDVDREGCWWPYIRRWWDVLLERPVFRIPELIKERPFPEPPDPIGPISRFAGGGLLSPGVIRGFNPQPDPPRVQQGLMLHRRLRPGEDRMLNPQPLPPKDWALFDPQPDPPGDPLSILASQLELAGGQLESAALMASSQTSAATRVGEMRALPSNVASLFEKLTLTSRIPPWLIFPRCFYSRQLVCETYTDCDGFFRCCFRWPRFHFRRGRLRYDSRPDIIIRVTQVIDGAETVIYMDPYTSTRWNVTNAHVDLYLDNEDVQCGSGCDPTPTPGNPVFFTRIGDDEVYLINQNNGLYEVAPLSNVAYGGTLYVYAQFGDDLTDGVPARYYRLSYAKQGTSNFTPITTPLSDTRVNKATFFSETHTLGPVTVGTAAALFEVRNFANFYWYNPDWAGTWYSWITEEDTGTYILRLEMFDEAGNLLTAAQVDYRDGTIVPPATVPPMTVPPKTPSPPSVRVDRCDLVITLDNKAPVLDLQIPAVLNDCGVIPFSSVPPLNFTANVTQENNRLHSWSLTYLKGVNPTFLALGPGSNGSSNTGLPGTISQSVDGSPLLVGLTSTCAFALNLVATAHIRDGRNFIYHVQQIKAIAIEKCPPCPPPPPR